MKTKKTIKAPKAAEEMIKAMDTKLFRALAEPVRLDILKFIVLNGRSDISSIAANLPQDRSVISRHLNLLAETGILRAEKESRHIFYAINGTAFLTDFEKMVKKIRKCMSACCP